MVPPTARVHICRGHELEVFKLLEQRGIIGWMDDQDVFRDKRGQYLSGMFGVVKQGKFTADNKPVLRCIMNLIPINGLFRVLRGDIHMLPSATSWMPLVLADGETLAMSQGDMHAAFYLFQLPSCWNKFMCFNFKVKGSSLGLTGIESTKWFRPTCKVLPMGWSSSVGIMQAISREILLCKGLPPQLELKRSSSVPAWFAQVTEAASAQRAWWQIYLDNFMSGEVADERTKGINLELQELAMGAWSSSGVLTAQDKQVLNKPEVIELGIRIDGTHALLGCSPERLLKTCYATIFHLRNSIWSKKEAQIILGRWIFILQFRRAGMSCLSRAWETVEKPWPSPADRELLNSELATLLCLGPLLQTDLSSSYDGQVTCSDASGSGGAAAVAYDLTWSGRSLVGRLSDGRLEPLKIPVLLVSLFNGIGGCFRLYDVLGLEPQGRLSVDISPFGRGSPFKICSGVNACG